MKLIIVVEIPQRTPPRVYDVDLDEMGDDEQEELQDRLDDCNTGLKFTSVADLEEWVGSYEHKRDHQYIAVARLAREWVEKWGDSF